MKKLAFLFVMFFNLLYAESNLSVYGASPPATYFIYSIEPRLLAGLNFPPSRSELNYLNENMKTLPIIGGWFGQGKTPNFETLAKINPDLVFVWNHPKAIDEVEKTLKKLNLKTVPIAIDKLHDYAKAYRDAGVVLNMRERTKILADYTDKILNELKVFSSIEESKRVKVYYAEGNDGLQTECHVSVHADLIEDVNGYNPHRCENRAGFGQEKISIEKLIIYNPDVIITQNREFFANVYNDSRFKQLKAIQNKRVYLIPDTPFNWFDRPPSFMKILCVQWLGNLLYPEVYKVDMRERTKEFFKLFLRVELSDSEITNILKGE